MDTRPIVEQIYGELKGRILTGTWPLGTRIFEEDLAREFQLSRGPIREALRFLEQEGLILRPPHRGLFVSAPSREEIYDVACLRALLEIYAVRWGDLPDGAALEEMRDVLCRMEEAEKSGDRMEAVNTDLAFHAVIVNQSKNAVLVRKFHELDGFVAIFLHAVVGHIPESLQGLTDRHRAIRNALTGGDIGTITRVIDEHYRASSRRLGCYTAGRITDGPIAVPEVSRV